MNCPLHNVKRLDGEIKAILGRVLSLEKDIEVHAKHMERQDESLRLKLNSAMKVLEAIANRTPAVRFIPTPSMMPLLIMTCMRVIRCFMHALGRQAHALAFVVVRILSPWRWLKPECYTRTHCCVRKNVWKTWNRSMVMRMDTPRSLMMCS